MKANGRVLIVAGSDSGGGAGIQADIKAVTCLGGYAMTAIAALTAQNTQGVTNIHDVPADFVAEQMRVVLSDLGADVIKTGMLNKPDVIAAICDVLESDAPGVTLVVDPVMIAKGGAALMADEAHGLLVDRLIPKAFILTPNIPEAEALTGVVIKTDDDAEKASRKLLEMGPDWILLKGGHLEGETVLDRLFGPAGESYIFESPRINTPHTHGTGCTLASSIATGLAQGLGVPDAVDRGRRYVLEAIKTAPGFGTGHGPLNHGHTVNSLSKSPSD